MSNRPAVIDFRSKSYDTMKSGQRSPSGQSSPRITHFDGEIPPTMSPLDVFAAQSRLLAKQLDDSKSNGRRVSRLPPLTIANSLARGPSYMQSRSADNTEGKSPGTPGRSKDDDSTGNTPEVEEPAFRPTSVYPRLSSIAASDKEDKNSPPSPLDQQFVTPAEFRPVHASDYFAGARARSPEYLPSTRGEVRNARLATRPPVLLSPQRSFDSTSQNINLPRSHTMEPSVYKGSDTNSLAPPTSPRLRQGGSIRSIPVDSSDDDLSASTGGSSFSQQRKLSSSSGVSMPQSPLTTFSQSHNRSPSQNSDHSFSSSRLNRPTFNFSRPLSRSSRPSADGASRQPSFDSRPSLGSRSRQPSSDSQRLIFSDDTVHTPISMEPEQYHESKDYQETPAPSYIYAKYSLPRGRILQRESNDHESRPIHRFEWEQSPLQSNVIPATPPADDRPMSPSSTTLSTSKTSLETSRSSDRPSAEHDKPRQNRPPPIPISDEKYQESSASMHSGSTIKARPNRGLVSSLELSAEEHLAKGIELHESGSLKESTYHLRIAAKQKLPTAMLLYALACRHGWGMRPNQEEGVQWLRKAADSASLEVVDGEDHLQDGLPTDVLERKTRRAQFALSIYELGVSHMNGWGIEQDKALALRCFEIAGNWGDADAMTEAGFCYAQGTGCKKDLKKAAKYYRMAEAKGVSMVGNSWYVLIKRTGIPLTGFLNRIYKPKYADDSNDRQARPAKQSTPERKTRDKSRTRTIFGRKKSIGTKT